MLEKSEFIEAKRDGELNNTSYTPSKSPNFSGQEERDRKDADRLLRQLDDADAPQLTQQQKEEFRIRCKQKVEEVDGYLRDFSSSKHSLDSQESRFKSLKEMCDPNAIITIRTKYNNLESGGPTGTSRRISIKEFWNKIKNREIDLREYDLSDVSFNRGEFIKKELPMPNGGVQIIWIRKINNITLETKGEKKPNVCLMGLEDVATIEGGYSKNDGFFIEK